MANIPSRETDIKAYPLKDIMHVICYFCFFSSLSVHNLSSCCHPLVITVYTLENIHASSASCIFCRDSSLLAKTVDSHVSNDSHLSPETFMYTDGFCWGLHMSTLMLIFILTIIAAYGEENTPYSFFVVNSVIIYVYIKSQSWYSTVTNANPLQLYHSPRVKILAIYLCCKDIVHSHGWVIHLTVMRAMVRAQKMKGLK